MESMAKSPAWQRKAGKNPKGGLNAAGRASAKAQGMNLKPPVKRLRLRDHLNLLEDVSLFVAVCVE
jgi:hypothetical protein